MGYKYLVLCKDIIKINNHLIKIEKRSKLIVFLEKLFIFSTFPANVCILISYDNARVQFHLS